MIHTRRETAWWRCSPVEISRCRIVLQQILISRGVLRYNMFRSDNWKGVKKRAQSAFARDSEQPRWTTNFPVESGPEVVEVIIFYFRKRYTLWIDEGHELSNRIQPLLLNVIIYLIERVEQFHSVAVISQSIAAVEVVIRYLACGRVREHDVVTRIVLWPVRDARKRHARALVCELEHSVGICLQKFVRLQWVVRELVNSQFVCWYLRVREWALEVCEIDDPCADVYLRQNSTSVVLQIFAGRSVLQLRERNRVCGNIAVCDQILI